MRVSYVRQKDMLEMSLQVPDGIWFGASPFSVPLAGGWQRMSVLPGITPFYDNTGRRMVVEVDDVGRGGCLISPPD
jgi:hypothetical protein